MATILTTFATILFYNRACDFMSNNKAILTTIIFVLLLQETLKQIKTL
jgi:hypothetical protein